MRPPDGYPHLTAKGEVLEPVHVTGEPRGRSFRLARTPKFRTQIPEYVCRVNNTC